MSDSLPSPSDDSLFDDDDESEAESDSVSSGAHSPTDAAFTASDDEITVVAGNVPHYIAHLLDSFASPKGATEYDDETLEKVSREKKD
jgi:hypothetical protein